MLSSTALHLSARTVGFFVLPPLLLLLRLDFNEESEPSKLITIDGGRAICTSPFIIPIAPKASIDRIEQIVIREGGEKQQEDVAFGRRQHSTRGEILRSEVVRD